MTVISSQSLTDFIANQSVKSSTSLQFGSGCFYEGSMKENRACGFGLFKWENETFEGFFQDGVRVKVGIQKWNDGDKYIGEFYKDKRHGWGIYSWWNGDSYEGSFFEDLRHGYGKYKSKDGDIFEGTFYKNRREGFGVLRYSSGDIFHGLYKENYRCGPGILIYENGCHDIGLWHRGSLLKLIVNMEEVFQMSQFSELMTMYPFYTSDSMKHLPVSTNSSDFETDNSLDNVLTYRLTKPKSIQIFQENKDDINEEKETLGMVTNNDSLKDIVLENNINDDQIKNISKSLENSLPESKITIELIESEDIVDPHTIEIRQEHLLVDDTFHNFFEKLTTPHTTTSIMLKIFNHIKRFSKNIPKADGVISLNDVVRDVITNIFKQSPIIENVDRLKKYQLPGSIETNSFKLISYSHMGHHEEVTKLFLNSMPPNPNVTDCRGSFSLLEAVLTWNISLVNYLLDCGADINQITDEGVSALGACFLFYYPQKDFIDTIAEGIVTLSYTPMNFNGVRREPIKNPNPQTEAHDSSPNHIDVKIVENIDDFRGGIVEHWNDYQTIVSPKNITENESESQDAKDFFMKYQKSKFVEYKSEDFDSYPNNIEYPTKVGQKLLEKAASALSTNSLMMQRQPRPNSRSQVLSTDEGTARFKALQISRHNQMLEIILLLLRRGADPNICKIPFPTIFFSVKSGDVEMTKVLIAKGANVNARLGPQNFCLTPLHISSCLPGKRGIVITELLLMNGADPNGRASEDESFLDKTLMDEWSKDIITDEQKILLGGKTPLHLACSRYDDFKISHQIVLLLLQYGGDPNLICNGHSSFTLAIASGNDLIVDKLLAHDKLNINLSLTHGLGNAICVASSTSFEHSRSIEARISLIKKIIAAGADVLNLVPIGFKRSLGSAVDYAYNVFFMDQRVSRLPYHALTSVERDLFNNRKNILSYMGMFTRECAVEKEKARLKSMKIEGIESRGPSPDFVWTGAGADPENQRSFSKALSKISHNLTNLDLQMQGSDLLARKPLVKYCYECGRSVNVKLTACTRCKEVFFCSKLCKTKAWNTRHKFECLRVGGRASTAGSEHKSNRNIDSPTPATILEDVTLAKKSFDLKKNDQTKQNKKATTDILEPKHKVTQPPRKLPPLDSKSHPSYSYAYVMDDYIKFDQQDQMIILKNTFVDNYSFE